MRALLGVAVSAAVTLGCLVLVGLAVRNVPVPYKAPGGTVTNYSGKLQGDHTMYPADFPCPCANPWAAPNPVPSTGSTSSGSTGSHGSSGPYTTSSTSKSTRFSCSPSSLGQSCSLTTTVTKSTTRHP